ncbi:hypothetical protein V6N12_070655 [Hibiscus sabdariffa]|uniref:Uncharacterized protein n=1 Tax=Hibiscus sabdariffa TaxID=183260 RepID=A0ABR2FHH0_9ROSI
MTKPDIGVSIASPEEALPDFSHLESYLLEGRALLLNYAKAKKKLPKPENAKPVPVFRDEAMLWLGGAVAPHGHAAP